MAYGEKAPVSSGGNGVLHSIEVSNDQLGCMQSDLTLIEKVDRKAKLIFVLCLVLRTLAATVLFTLLYLVASENIDMLIAAIIAGVFLFSGNFIEYLDKSLTVRNESGLALTRLSMLGTMMSWTAGWHHKSSREMLLVYRELIRNGSAALDASGRGLELDTSVTQCRLYITVPTS